MFAAVDLRGKKYKINNPELYKLWKSFETIKASLQAKQIIHFVKTSDDPVVLSFVLYLVEIRHNKLRKISGANLRLYNLCGSEMNRKKKNTAPWWSEEQKKDTEG